MAKIRVLAAEDDALHADALRMVIDQLGYELIAIVDEPAELLCQLKATRPDVLLMDIDLGAEESGIELVKKMNECADVPVIYVTSFKEEETFRKAMETLPEAYLLKPYDPALLKSAIELAVFRKQNFKRQLRIKPAAAPAALNAVFVKEGRGLVKLLLKDILLVEAYDKYCYVHTHQTKHLLNTQIKNLLNYLPPEQFLQVHRSYLVNLEAIDKILPQQQCLEIAGKQVPVSKSYKSLLYAHLTTL
jgi:DNA-binding LytR/AlgR family response regulator